MKKLMGLVFLGVALMVVALPAKGQGGCDDSPENPTLILAGLAGGVYAVKTVRMRLKSRGRK